MRIEKRYIKFGFLSMMAMGLASCSNSEDPSVENNPSLGNHDGYALSFQMEGMNTATRGSNGYDGAETGIIGTGSKIDYLIFAIYDNKGNILTKFAKEENASLTINGKTLKAGEGQNLLALDGNKSIGYTLTSIEPGEYTVVCWAQSSECDAYDTSDFSNVKVSYTNNNDDNNNNNLYLNNDESRDAFCASESFTVLEDVDGSSEVILIRPFAQINVGTSGADYRNTALTPGSTYYTHSAIELKNVASTINLLTGETGKADQAVTFGYAPMPAWYEMDIPVTNASKIQTTGEQFLQIHLNDLTDNSTTAFARYLTEYPTVEVDDEGNITRYLTETFKYLSMCYVLVPGKTTLDQVKISFADDDNGNHKSELEVPNLPVNTNWRTNIIGGLWAPEKPDPPTTDPSSPLDPDNTLSVKVIVVSTYNNPDNNYQRDEEEENGFTEIN